MRPIEFQILLTLAACERHGYAIIQDIEERSGGVVTVETGTLYRALQRLLAGEPVRSSCSLVGSGSAHSRFSFLHTAMIRPLPLGGGDRILRLTQLEDGRRRQVDLVDVAPLRASMRSVRNLGAYTRREVIIGRGERDRRVLTTTATDRSLFTVARAWAFSMPPSR